MTLTISHPGARRIRVSRGVLAGVAATFVAVGGYQVATNVGTDEPAPAIVETQETTTFGADSNFVWPEITGLVATPAVIDPSLAWPEVGGLPALPETGATSVTGQSVTPQPNPAASASIGSSNANSSPNAGSLVR